MGMSVIERPKYVEELFGEIALMDEQTYPPKTPMQEGDNVIGDVPMYARKLWALSQFYMREFDQQQLECKYTPCEEHHGLHDKLRETINKRDFLMCLFWMVCQKDLQKWPEHGIGIRKDWKLVARPEPKPGQGPIFGLHADTQE